MLVVIYNHKYIINIYKLGKYFGRSKKKNKIDKHSRDKLENKSKCCSHVEQGEGNAYNNSGVPIFIIYIYIYAYIYIL
jgi:hypothetical protein